MNLVRAGDIENMVAKIKKDHDNLRGINVAVFLNISDKDKDDEDGNNVAKAGKATDYEKCLCPSIMAKITIDESLWKKLDDRQKEACLDHELCHLYFDGKKIVIIEHDIEEFSFVLRKHGAWSKHLQGVKSSMVQASLFPATENKYEAPVIEKRPDLEGGYEDDPPKLEASAMLNEETADKIQAMPEFKKLKSIHAKAAKLKEQGWSVSDVRSVPETTTINEESEKEYNEATPLSEFKEHDPAGILPDKEDKPADISPDAKDVEPTPEQADTVDKTEAKEVPMVVTSDVDFTNDQLPEPVTVKTPLGNRVCFTQHEVDEAKRQAKEQADVIGV